jgi:hypothetical protein
VSTDTYWQHLLKKKPVFNFIFRVLGVANFNCSGAVLVLEVLAKASRRKNHLVHISSDLVTAVKENTAVFVLQTKLRILYWKFDIVRSLYINASFITRVILLLSFLNSLLCSTKQEEDSPK